MKKRTCNTLLRFAMSVFVVMIAWAMAPGARSCAGELAPIPLPPPPSRDFAPDPIPAQTLSNLLWADAGFISQNIYLFCASEGLATGVRALVDRPVLAKALGLKDNQVVLLAQCVGRPAP
jgi:nitroreductase